MSSITTLSPLLDLQVTKWKRSLRDSTVLVKPNSKYTINPTLNKRQNIFENGIWANTKPILLN